jgi:hypothetical protein
MKPMAYLSMAGAPGFFKLARRDLRDHDGRADYVGGALLTSGASGHCLSGE